MPRRSSIRQAVRLLSVLAALLLISGCTTLRVPEGADDDWTAHYHDASRSNASGASFAMPLKEVWDRDFDPWTVFNPYPKWQRSAPAVVGGKVYFGSTNRSFYALDAAHGFADWRHKDSSTIETPPAVSGSRVCFGTGAGVLRCLDASTGREVMSYRFNSELVASPAISGGTIYVFSSDDRLHALDLETGEKLWTYARGTYRAIAQRMASSPALARTESGDAVFQVFSDGSLVSVDAATGKVLWEKKVAADLVASPPARRTPLVHGSSVYVIDGEGSVVGFSVEDGAATGVYRIEKAVDFLFTGGALIAAGEGSMTAFDTKENAVVWKKPVEFGPVDSLLLSGGHVFAVSNYEKAPWGIKMFTRVRGRIQAFRVSDGERVWDEPLRSTVKANASAAPGILAVFTDRGEMRIYTTSKK